MILRHAMAGCRAVLRLVQAKNLKRTIAVAFCAWVGGVSFGLRFLPGSKILEFWRHYDTKSAVGLVKPISFLNLSVIFCVGACK